MSEWERFDLGLQPERTALAWQRTTLALLVGSAVALRLLPPVFGAWSFSIGSAGLLATATLWAASSVRARRVERSLRTAAGLPGGALLAATAACASCAAGICLVYAAAHWR